MTFPLFNCLSAVVSGNGHTHMKRTPINVYLHVLTLESKQGSGEANKYLRSIYDYSVHVRILNKKNALNVGLGLAFVKQMDRFNQNQLAR